MRELLIRYLLGELDQDEHQDVQRQLAASAELRRELAHLRTCFAAACQEDELPCGLAERTSEHVAGYEVDCNDACSSLRNRGATLAEASDPPAGVLGWSLADLTVAGGVVLAVSMFIFPALRNSRDETRRHVCQNNQRELWMLISEYSQKHGNYVPRVHLHENAGIFTVRLVEEGHINAEDLAVLLVCPSAPLADLIRAGTYAVKVPTIAELQAMSPDELAKARRDMSPFFAYRLGYRVGSRYYHVRNDGLPLPILSDTAGTEADTLISPNHEGMIVQVMHMDGSLRSVAAHRAPTIAQDLFRNDLGQVAPGLSRRDDVLGRSEATPGNLSLAIDR